MAGQDDNLSKEVADNLNKKPPKGILKNSSSFETAEYIKCKSSKDKTTKWDEMNIIATLHPPDKDYGHMKVDEPKTPFERDIPDDVDGGIDPDLLAKQMIKKKEDLLKIHLSPSDESESEPDDEETPEQRAARKAFENKRKAHYNEFFAAKMARKLLEEEEEEEEEEKEDENYDNSNATPKRTEESKNESEFHVLETEDESDFLNDENDVNA